MASNTQLELTKEQVIKHVKRSKLEPKLDAHNKPLFDQITKQPVLETVEVALTVDEILDLSVTVAGAITVVTTDGHKFTGKLPPAELKKAKAAEKA